MIDRGLRPAAGCCPVGRGWFRSNFLGSGGQPCRSGGCGQSCDAVAGFGVGRCELRDQPRCHAPAGVASGDLDSCWLLLVGLAQSGFRAFSIAGYLGPTTSTLNQTLAVNGYNLVPSSTELVTSFYGQWTYWPGGPTLVQGQQQYSVVDPASQENLGTFDALVSTGQSVQRPQ